MLDQNTDRMWFVIGAVIVGAAIIFIANGTIPEIFASVTQSFEESSNNALAVVDEIGQTTEYSENLIHHNYDFTYGFEEWTNGGGVSAGDVSGNAMVDDSTYGKVAKIGRGSSLRRGLAYKFPTRRAQDNGKSYRLEAVVRADSDMKVSLSFDGHGAENGRDYAIGTEWKKIVLERESNGENGVPRIYASEGYEDVYYVAEMTFQEEIVEEGD